MNLCKNAMKNGKKQLKSGKNIIVRLGIIGCGSVSEMYLDYLSNTRGLSLYACSDLDPSLAKSVANKYGFCRVLSASELVNSPEIDIVLNLTNPSSHFGINLAVLNSKKALFCEKPYALNNSQADKLLNLAKKNNCLFYSAPDTYLAKSLQSAKKYIEKGKIGKVLSVNIISTCNPVEAWHPNPEFFYKKGAGPLFDRGVYYLTALVFLFGQIISVGGYSEKFIKKRYFKSKGTNNKIIVETSTHYAIILKFKSGVSATMIISFDAKQNPVDNDIMTIFGLSGTIKMPTPLEYGGLAYAYDHKIKKWTNINNYSSGYFVKGDVRGVAIMEMIKELKSKKLNFDNAELANHVIKVMNAIEASGKNGKLINLK